MKIPPEFKDIRRIFVVALSIVFGFILIAGLSLLGSVVSTNKAPDTLILQPYVWGTCSKSPKYSLQKSGGGNMYSLPYCGLTYDTDEVRDMFPQEAVTSICTDSGTKTFRFFKKVYSRYAIATPTEVYGEYVCVNAYDHASPTRYLFCLRCALEVEGH